MDVMDGSASDNTYLVRYDEDNWLDLPAKTKEYSLKYWRLKATALNTPYLVLMLVPDALFPRSPTNIKPYVAHSEKLDTGGTPQSRVEIETYVLVNLRNGANYEDYEKDLKRTYASIPGKVHAHITDSDGVEVRRERLK